MFTKQLEWQYTDKLVRHKDGYTIELIRGSWEEPLEIRPGSTRDMSAKKASQLLREGLSFAAKRDTHKRKPRLPVVPSTKRPILSLRK